MRKSRGGTLGGLFIYMGTDGATGTKQMIEKHVIFHSTRDDGFDIDEWQLKMEDRKYIKLILRILEEKNKGEGAVLEAKELSNEVERRIEMHGSIEQALSYRPN